MHSLSVPILMVFMVGCAHQPLRYPGSTRHLSGSPEDPPERRATAQASKSEPKRAAPRGRKVGQAATYYLGKSKLRVSSTTYRYDCSGFVDAAHARAGVDLGLRNAAALHTLAQEEKLFSRSKRQVDVGDTIFFDNTHDRNHNGRLDDRNTHVAIVNQVDSDGTIHMVHLGSRGVTRLRMNLREPGVHKNAAGKELNSFLRVRRSADPRHTVYLAGELWSGTGSFWRSGSGLFSKHQEGAQDQRIELAFLPSRDGVMRRADDGLFVSIEAGVDQGG